MSGCTVFVFLSLMEYALVNIVMGDIADIEKKKNSGLTNLLLGVRAGAGPGMPGAAGVSQKPQKSFQAMQVVKMMFTVYIDVRIVKLLMQEMSNMGMGLSIHEQEHKDPEVGPQP